MDTIFATLLVALVASKVYGDPLVDNVDHIIIIYEENWSFDAMFAAFPGANGHVSNKSVVLHPQTNLSGIPYDTLPPIFDIPDGMPNVPFLIDTFINDTLLDYPDPTHKYYEEQYMINGGLMDRYIAWNKAGSISYSYWNSTDEYIGRLAQNYTLFDNFFHSAFGPSLLNHFWMACACTPKWESETPPPSSQIAVLDKNGFYTNPSAPTITPDLYVVGTLSSAIPPIDPSADPTLLVPPITNATIGDLLSDAGISWAYYQDGYGEANSGHASPKFEYNHNPYLYFAKYANGTQERADHMKDTTEFLSALSSNSLPKVSWIKPMSPHNFHPHDSDRKDSQDYLEKLINAIQSSPYWDRSLVIVTFDEHGGFFDHVPPPAGDRWGPGSRVPTIMVSPFAKKGFIDSTESETLSIIRLLQRRFNLPALGVRAAKNDLTSSLDFPATIETSTASRLVSYSILALIGLYFVIL
eukprot:Phypoly_transcript_07443.p1 GENE.Phypoly_transcript_07443~~Phypoly_transcript_07443.p1  ORF type:complete len:468 (+),score=66.13 Phypoly_transcript_07443:212-1615(+)